MRGKGHHPLLLAREQRAVNPVPVQFRVALRRQKTERREVHPLPGPLEALERVVRLAGVGRPRVEDDPALVEPRVRVPFPRSPR